MATATTCRYCGTSIGWRETPTGWRPTNAADGSLHYCDRTKVRVPQETREQVTQQAIRMAEEYQTQVVHISADQWDEFMGRLDSIIGKLEGIEALLTRAPAESEWEWPDGVKASS